jgi:flagellar motor switch protein FliM
MTESTHATLLRRMTRPQDVDVVENPLTSSRAVRLALTKAANDTVGLILTVSSVAEDVSELDAMLDGLPDGLMLVGLHRQDRLVGLIALDMQLRAAVLEMETMGVLSPQSADDRAPTRTDKMMCGPLIAGFLDAFPQAVRGTDFDGWGDHITHEDQIADTRSAGLLLDDCPYRIVQMNVQLGAADRQGLLLVALPLVDEPQDVSQPVEVATNWNVDFPKAVQDAPAVLTALLHRFSLPLATARALQIGTVLPLPGCNVSSVRLIATDGKAVAQAKLGQSGGMRAVRLQAAPLPDLHDLSAPMGAEPVVLAVEDGLDLPIDLAEPAPLDTALAVEGDAESLS